MFELHIFLGKKKYDSHFKISAKLFVLPDKIFAEIFPKLLPSRDRFQRRHFYVVCRDSPDDTKKFN
jgi:hypothetical protein